MKAVFILLPFFLASNSFAHKLPPEVQVIVSEALNHEADLENGKKLYQNSCLACHGDKGLPQNLRKGSIPYLADQAPKYLLIHMAMFKTKHRISPVMNSVVQKLNSQDMADLKTYLVSEDARAVHCNSELHSEQEFLDAFRGDIDAGRILAETKRDFQRADGSTVGISCTMCHGDNGLMPEEYREGTMHPDLAAQSPKYLYQEFLKFKKKTRVNAGPMNLMVRDLNKKQLRDLSAYYGSLTRCR